MLPSAGRELASLSSENHALLALFSTFSFIVYLKPTYDLSLVLELFTSR